MKYLGIDYGTKRIGIAISDDEGILAFPKTVLANTPRLAEAVAAIAKSEAVTAIVVGESKNYRNEPNPLMHAIVPFARKLELASGIAPVFHTEVLTSREAAHVQGDNAMNDASAAALMLQSYLDVINRRPSIDLDDGE